MAKRKILESENLNKKKQKKTATTADSSNQDEQNVNASQEDNDGEQQNAEGGEAQNEAETPAEQQQQEGEEEEEADNSDDNDEEAADDANNDDGEDGDDAEDDGEDDDGDDGEDDEGDEDGDADDADGGDDDDEDGDEEAGDGDEPEDDDTADENDYVLDASDTESDDNNAGNNSAPPPSRYSNPHNKTPSKQESLVEKVANKYKDLQGKQLFIRFPSKLPDTQELLNEQVKALSDLIKVVHKPRQKFARHCLAEFESKEDRDSAMKTIAKLIKKNEKFAGIFIDLPKTENDSFIAEIIEKKQKSLENKKAKARLKKQQKKAMVSKVFTSSVIVANLPKIITAKQLREVFPNAIDINIKPVKAASVDTTMATINLPSTLDASRAVKQKIALNGSELVIKFSKDIKKYKNKNKNNKKNFSKNTKPNLQSKKKEKTLQTVVYDKSFKKPLK